MRARILLILMFASASLSAHSVVGQDGYIEVEHSWKYNGKDCCITLNISEDLYGYYQNEREHLAYHYKIEKAEMPVNFYTFILSDYDRAVMQALASQFEGMAISDYGRVNAAMTFVQSLPYAYDTDSKGEEEYVRYPVETLVDGCGDCEDKVMLLAAVLHEMDIDFILLSLPDHLALAVRCDGVKAERYISFLGKKYYYVETTMEGWQIGQVPPDYIGLELEVYPGHSEPTLLIKGLRFDSKATQVYEKADCEFRVRLQNLGPGRVTGLQMYLQVVHDDGHQPRVLSESVFALDDLPEGVSRAETLLLKSHIREHSRLLVEIHADGIPSQNFNLALDYTKVKAY